MGRRRRGRRWWNFLLRRLLSACVSKNAIQGRRRVFIKVKKATRITAANQSKKGKK